ncbi:MULTISPECIES: ComEA family DNA-binding protein [unclassified Gilliamella]|uniref:ComEA family DNA-binding protein n=1 Tax=unclassified Gilliamella TaxID=2685620 RepID=UPI00226A1CEF|nr:MULTISPECIES: helix-hairpin-helix domain-containing protein [unclassified Gilliamella]MCX8583141.1 helix-hairpin-helix domain-containing protein [Gilliamella sp. B3372]MCX8593447.1 helix-hairpin-helix domain-containing protein [Gilliamella sp. B3367]MCX8670389.1 helix-hairpin-helix domain-containing protein [Gilliamella sp. B2785]MCX8678068.1 helix-hairpin-helix domain-containing protein [Gilliamella sp. B2865]
MKIFTLLCLLFSSLLFSTVSFADSKADVTIKDEQIVQVNINTATAEELSKVLTGIGMSKAKKIIEYREKFGPFVSIEQLKEVSGIGQATLDKNIGKITL